jgi:hypothetical protein
MATSFISVEGILYARIPATELLDGQVDVQAVMVLPPEDGLKVDLPAGTVTSLKQITSLPDVELVGSQIGTAATGVVAPTGATGLLGWLSGIYSRFLLPTALGDNGGIKADLASLWDRLMTAPDLVQTYSYLSAGDPVDERISTITRSSVARSLTVVETYAYAGAAGSYRLSSITRSVS